MPLQTIDQWKQQEITETPVLLFECALSNGRTERWGTHALTFGGNSYAARILQHGPFELKASADEGLETSGRITLKLANADSYASQIERNIGFKGAQLTVRFLFFDLLAGVAASEDRVMFRGTANAPVEIREAWIQLSFSNRLNLQRQLVPEVRIQRRCPWTFPATAAQRAEAVSGGGKGRFSPFYRCGYSPDQTGGLGNLNAGSPFTSCDYTRASCQARGMFDSDSAAHITRRFGGIEFVPSTILVRSYGEKGSHLSPVLDNEARYNDFVPLVYGTAWFDPPLVFSRNDGNLTRMEVLLGMGEINAVRKVIVNGIEIPEGVTGANMTGTGWYNLVTPGTRSGGFNLNFTDGTGKPIGDPYGSMAMLSIVTPNRIANGQSTPPIQVLMQGMKLSRYAADGTYVNDAFTNNPAWVLLDLLRRAGWQLTELDLGSFSTVADFCGAPVNITDPNGNPVARPRYQCNLVLENRRSVADVVRGIRNGSALTLSYSNAGLLQLRAEGTLAMQQSTQPASSNGTTSLNGGWPVYEFSDASAAFSGILRNSNGEPQLRLWSRLTSESPNRFTVEFQDEFNEYQQDSLSLVDENDAQLTGQDISASLPVFGMPNFDQSVRIARLALRRSIRGNCFIDFATSVRGIGILPGDLITVTYAKEGLNRQPFRVIKVSPATNGGVVTISAQWHDDAWYTEAASATGASGRDPGPGAGLPRPLIGASIDARGRQQFSVAETVTQNSDGSFSVSLAVGFVAPRQPAVGGPGVPILSVSPVICTTGGTIAGGTAFYYALSAVDATGAEGRLSFTVKAAIPPGTNTNSVALTGLSFPSTAANFNVYRGPSPQQLMQVATGVALAAQWTDVGASLPSPQGPPDENFDHANFYWRWEQVPETTTDTFSPATIGNQGLGMLPNEWRQSLVRIAAGTGAGQERAVISNTATTLTVSPAWTITPDATSTFTVSEATWHFGALGSDSPVIFAVPNRKDSTVQISGRAANVNDQECSYELSPLTRWRIGGAGEPTDASFPAKPVFALSAPGDGTLMISGVAFSDLTNTRTINSGTFTAFVWDELGSPASLSLASAIDAAATVVVLNHPGSFAAGDLLQVDAEILLVQSVSGTQVTAARGSHTSLAVSHASGVAVYPLARRVTILPFARDFFGSPASGSYGYSTMMPGVRVAAAEFFVTNSQGNSDIASAAFGSTVDGGLRTLSGGQFTLQVEGYLAIQTGAVPPLIIERPTVVRDVSAVLGEAPVGGSVGLRLTLNGAIYATLTIPAGATVSSVFAGFGVAPLPSGATLGLDVVLLPAGDGSRPGRNLTVTVRI